MFIIGCGLSKLKDQINYFHSAQSLWSSSHNNLIPGILKINEYTNRGNFNLNWL